jgi:ferric-dicitrate binding protein FerR (iron transport regulator)
VGVTPQSTQKREILSPGEKIWAPDSKTFVVQSEINEPLWTSGSYYYQNEDLSAVLEELARQYQMELVLKTSVAGRKYSGVFTDSDMKSAIYSVCWPMKLRCEVVETKLIISEK